MSAAGKNVDVVICFDTTGSMAPCLNEARKHIAQLVRRLFTDLPGIHIGLIAHGDYCDLSIEGSYLMKGVDLTTNQDELVNFVLTVSPTSGGDVPECQEYVLHKVQSFKWRLDAIKALVMVGDSYPHEVDENPGRLDWRKETAELAKMGVVIYSVQALNVGNHASHAFCKTMADCTHGYHLYLDQFSYIRDVILAVCLKQDNDARVQAFEQELVVRPAGLSKSMRQFFDTMLKRTPAAAHGYDSKVAHVAPPVGIHPCAPSKYQVLDVPMDCSIKQFVASQPGLTFKAGRGFYEFTKPEAIGKKKEIVLMAADGTLYEGEHARSIARISDESEKKKIHPAALVGYTAFVQSTSYNRKLIGGTRFLYQAV